MKLTRREMIGGVGAGLAVAGCSGKLRNFAFGPEEAIAPPPSFEDPDAVLLNRIGFGPAPGERQQLKKLGREAYVDRQLGALQDEPLELTIRLNRLDVLRLTESDLHDLPEERVIEQLQQAAILRAVHNPNQLLER